MPHTWVGVAGMVMTLQQSSFYRNDTCLAPRYAVWSFTPENGGAPLFFRSELSTPTSHVLGAFCARAYKTWTAAHFAMDLHLPPVVRGVVNGGPGTTAYRFGCIIPPPHLYTPFASAFA